MPIPDFEDAVLPEGIHECTFDEIRERFGRFQRTDRRMNLTERLGKYFISAKASGIITAVIVNGSYTTAKDEPEDIDIIAVLDPNFDWTQELRPFQANMLDRGAIRREYRFDGFAYNEGEAGLQNLIAVFSTVPEKYTGMTGKSRKGMLRVRL